MCGQNAEVTKMWEHYVGRMLTLQIGGNTMWA
jgi:hypothetical protein